MFHETTKHIEVDLHSMHKRLEDEVTITLPYVSSNLQYKDISL